MKKILIGVGAVIVLLLAVVGAVLYSAFANNRPMVDGQALGTGVHIVKDGFVSIAVLDVGPDRVALIDCGNDTSGKAILAALASRGLTPASVAAIFLTHGHPDHVAGCKLFPNAQVYAMESETGVIGEAAKVTHPLRDGDISHEGSLQVEAFAVPGHTPGSAAYLADGVLFFGDSAGGAKDGTMMPAVRFFSKDSNQNLASLKALAARLSPRAAEVKTLAFAHTGPLEGFAPLATFASSH